MKTIPVSRACVEADFYTKTYELWCDEFKEKPRTHRKQWEFYFIAHSLFGMGYLKPENTGLGFGVGKDPMTSLFVKHGCQITALDLPPDRAGDWGQTNQHASTLGDLNLHKLVSQETLEANATLIHGDMNDIPESLKGFDFCWSSCALEHLGSIQHGLQFIRNSLDCLKSGGMAVHTTEFNCSSETDTFETGSTVLFRRSDLERLRDELLSDGHSIRLDFFLGDDPLDYAVDQPPYHDSNHLKLQLGPYVSTSFGLVIQRR